MSEHLENMEEIIDENTNSTLRRSKRVTKQQGATNKRSRAALVDISNQAPIINTGSKKATKRQKITHVIEQDGAVVHSNFNNTTSETSQTNVISVANDVQNVSGNSASTDDVDDDVQNTTTDVIDGVDVEDEHDDVEEGDCTATYVNDIFMRMRQNELKYQPTTDFMETIQDDINHTMRSILVDWLVEVAEEYKLKRQTLYLAINFIDRLLSRVSVSRTKLQLVGVTAMFVAAKYEEIYPPSVDDFVDITDNTYTRDEMFRLEGMLLKHLKFNLTVTTPFHYWPQFCKVIALDKRIQTLANFIMELALQEKYFNQYPASLMASSAIALALHTKGMDVWPAALHETTGYTMDDLKDCVQMLFNVYTGVNVAKKSLKAVKDKYNLELNFCVAEVPPPSSLWFTL